MNKKLLLLAVFLMSMVAISAASAAENTTDEISEVSKDTDNLEIVQEDELGTHPDDSFWALQTRIDEARPTPHWPWIRTTNSILEIFGKKMNQVSEFIRI